MRSTLSFSERLAVLSSLDSLSADTDACSWLQRSLNLSCSSDLCTSSSSRASLGADVDAVANRIFCQHRGSHLELMWTCMRKRPEMMSRGLEDAEFENNAVGPGRPMHNLIS